MWVILYFILKVLLKLIMIAIDLKYSLLLLEYEIIVYTSKVMHVFTMKRCPSLIRLYNIYKLYPQSKWKY